MFRSIVPFALLVLFCPVKKDSLESLIRDLKSPDEKVRQEAAEKLAELGRDAKPAVPELAEALNDPVPRVRSYAALALRKLGPDAEAAVASLVKALRKEPSALPVAEFAREALVAIGKPAVPALIDALNDEDDYIRTRSIVALGEIGREAKKAVPKLTEFLVDKNEEVRWRAAHALAHIDPENKAGAPILIKALKDKDMETRLTAADDLARLGEEGKPAIPVIIEALQDKKAKDPLYVFLMGWMAIWQFGPVAKDYEPTLHKIFLGYLEEAKGTDEVGILVLPAGALIKINPNNKEAFQTLKKGVPRLISGLSNKNRGVPAFSADVLGRLGPEAKDAVPALEKAAKSPDPELREAAQEALGRIQGKK